MSKIIYSLKMALLIGVYQMSPEDERIVVIMAQFCAIIYAKYWFEACLPTKAAVNDLKMLKMLQTYEKYSGEKDLAAVMGRHLWYLTESLVVLSLCNEDLEDIEREALAKELYLIPRKGAASLGKPTFPVMKEGIKLSDCIGQKSWLVFDLIGITKAEWLKIPCSLWNEFEDYRRFKQFVENLMVTNDVAERAISTCNRYLDKTKTESARQDNLQVVSYYRKNIPDLTKKSLSQNI